MNEDNNYSGSICILGGWSGKITEELILGFGPISGWINWSVPWMSIQEESRDRWDFWRESKMIGRLPKNSWDISKNLTRKTRSGSTIVSLDWGFMTVFSPVLAFIFSDNQEKNEKKSSPTANFISSCFGLFNLTINAWSTANLVPNFFIWIIV